MTDASQNSVGIVETQTVRLVDADSPLELQCGKRLGPIDAAYETYGQLSPEGDNAVLICHALSGDAHVAGFHSPEDRKCGWWDIMVGPGKPIDTNKYYVICSNILGGCQGTTGPSSINPQTGRPYGLDFPIITVSDMVQVQKLLIEKIGVRELLSVIGGSLGGMQAMQWAISYPQAVKSAIVIASTARLNAQSLAFDAVGRSVILADANYAEGRYHGGTGPDKGLAIARMIGHITYLSEEGMHQKFGRQLRNGQGYNYDFDSEFSVETYLDHQGKAFIERFDANSYLYITKAMDYFDLSREYGSLRQAFADTSSRFMAISFSSDWLFTDKQSEEICDTLTSLGKDVSYCNIHSPYGHDAFLLEPKTIGALLGGFLGNTQQMIRGHRIGTVHEPSPKQKKNDRARRLRVDYELIESLIEPASRVLDVGCGDGELLAKLTLDKDISGEGVELDQDMAVHCVQRGISVIHRDIERGLSQYAADSFDYAILSQTVQTVKDPKKALRELLRVAERVIVSFPNFAHWQCRFQMLFGGIAPRTKQLPARWHDSPNIHFLSLKDFDEFCDELGVRVEKRIPLGKSHLRELRLWPNLFAAQAVYVISKYTT